MKTPTIFLMTLLLAGCTGTQKPDLARLYRSDVIPASMPSPVILIHGITGSKLRHRESQQELWFGNLRKLLFSDFSSLALTIDPETLEPIQNQLEPFDIIGKAAGIDFYQAIITTLQQFGGYQLSEAGEPVTDFTRRLYVFTYDWRQDNVKSAQQLHTLINQLKTDYQNPNLKVDLVAHSMGGLISRYYLRYGDLDVLNGNDFPVNQQGAAHVRKIVLLGTPNLGSVGAVESFITGLKVGLRRIPTEVLVTMPSVYQLFPHSIHQWLINIKGEPLDRDVFDQNIWQRFEWSIYDPKVKQRIIAGFEEPADGEAYWQTLDAYFYKHIERARRFVWSLTVPAENPSYQLIVMGGDCQLTPARLLVEEVKGVSVTRLRPTNIKKPLPGVDYGRLMLEPGDGTVTKASLLARDSLDPSKPRHEYSFFPIDYPYFLCEDHSTLTANINFEDNLLHVLLSQ